MRLSSCVPLAAQDAPGTLEQGWQGACRRPLSKPRTAVPAHPIMSVYGRATLCRAQTSRCALRGPSCRARLASARAALVGAPEPTGGVSSSHPLARRATRCGRDIQAEDREQLFKLCLNRARTTHAGALRRRRALRHPLSEAAVSRAPCPRQSRRPCRHQAAAAPELRVSAHQLQQPQHQL